MFLVRPAGDLRFNVSPSMGPLVPSCHLGPIVSSLALPMQLSSRPLPHLLGGFGESLSFLSMALVQPGSPIDFLHLPMLTPGVLFRVARDSSRFKVIWKWIWDRDEPLTQFCLRKAKPEREALPLQPGLTHPGKMSQVGKGKGGEGRFRPRLCGQLA